MKNKLLYSIMLLAILFSGVGCKKFLDVNTDPNTTPSVPELLILPPVEMTISTVIAAGCYSSTNGEGIAVINSYWIQQLSLNQPTPIAEDYKLKAADVDNQWQDIYVTVLQNLNSMSAIALKNGNHSYDVISKILTAYTLGVATDVWGDIPYSKALNGNFLATYDKQEDVYKSIQHLLDTAIIENQNVVVGNSVPSTDDFIYGGDMTKWQKLAYTLKARYYLHLTKAPGYNAVTQANLALAALQNGFTSAADEADVTAYSTASGHESPWFENFQLSQGGVVLASTFINNEISRNDPRLPILANKGSGGNYLGRDIGSSPTASDAGIFSTAGNYIAGAGAQQVIVGYPEVEFIKAEATLISSGVAAAQPLYLAAVQDNMTRLGLSLTDPGVVAYISARGTLTTSNALQLIIEEKFVADFLSVENFNDWRRTGFPALSVVLNPYVPTIPRRYPYPLDELTSNPQPQQSALITDRVWWDTP